MLLSVSLRLSGASGRRATARASRLRRASEGRRGFWQRGFASREGRGRSPSPLGGLGLASRSLWGARTCRPGCVLRNSVGRSAPVASRFYAPSSCAALPRGGGPCLRSRIFLRGVSPPRTPRGFRIRRGRIGVPVIFHKYHRLHFETSNATGRARVLSRISVSRNSHLMLAKLTRSSRVSSARGATEPAGRSHTRPAQRAEWSRPDASGLSIRVGLGAAPPFATLTLPALPKRCANPKPGGATTTDLLRGRAVRSQRARTAPSCGSRSCSVVPLVTCSATCAVTRSTRSHQRAGARATQRSQCGLRDADRAAHFSALAPVRR